MLFPPANDVIPQIQARPPSDRASSRASSIWTTTSPPWPPCSSAIPIPWYPAAVSLSQRSNGYSCSRRSASRGPVLRALAVDPRPRLAPEELELLGQVE